MRRITIAATLACWCCLAETAWAGISYSYVTDQSNYNVSAGNPATVIVYLQEALTGASVSLIHGDGGLYNAAVALSTFSGTSATITGAAINTTDWSGNVGSGTPAGSTASLINNASSLSAGSAAFASGPTMTVINGTTTDLLYKLGTLTISYNGSAGVTTYDLKPYNGSAGGFTTTDGQATGPYDLDLTNDSGNSIGGSPGVYTGAFANSPTSFTVTAVPEPSSVILTGLVFSGLAFGAYRRRMKNAANEVA